MPLTWPAVTLILGVLAFVAYLLWWVDRVAYPRKGSEPKYVSNDFEAPHLRPPPRRGPAAAHKTRLHIDDRA